MLTIATASNRSHRKFSTTFLLFGCSRAVTGKRHICERCAYKIKTLHYQLETPNNSLSALTYRIAWPFVGHVCVFISHTTKIYMHQNQRRRQRRRALQACMGANGKSTIKKIKTLAYFCFVFRVKNKTSAATNNVLVWYFLSKVFYFFFVSFDSRILFNTRRSYIFHDF